MNCLHACNETSDVWLAKHGMTPQTIFYRYMQVIISMFLNKCFLSFDEITKQVSHNWELGHIIWFNLCIKTKFLNRVLFYHWMK
jgi:hypothetical protein